MNKHSKLSSPRLRVAVALSGLALLQACSTVPTQNARLEEARSDYRTAQANPKVRDGAPVELQQAADSLARADAAWAKREDMATVEQLAYIARQRTALATQTGERRAAEADIARASTERDQLRLAARTREADAAQRSAQSAQVDAQSAQSQARMAERDARVAQRSAEASQRNADASQQQTAMAQAQATAAEQRALQAEQQLRDMDAKKTPRGMVVTIGDVLFDSGRAELKGNALRSMDKLVAFLQAYPTRKAVVEGFTDSVGGSAQNQDLSMRRADAVRAALVSRGVDAGRIGAQGYGESFPVAGNASAGERQLNRRVEIVLSDEGGSVAPR